MAKKVEWVDDWRRCYACAGPKHLVQFRITQNEGDLALLTRDVDFHPTCIGAWLMTNQKWNVAFVPGER